MPTYEYECRRCQRRLEIIRRLSDPPLTECPECGGELRKLVSAPAFHLKGSGWYVTDYAKKGGEGAAKGEASEGGEGKATDAGGDKSGGDRAGGDKAGDVKSGDVKSGDAKSGATSKESSSSAAPSGGAKTAAGGSSG
jgi:putative FmdB family regulatory protein